jgi:hypothetical protein
MANANKGPWHLSTLHVYQVKQVSGMIMPPRVISEKRLIQYAAVSLGSNVCYPNASDVKAPLL